MSMSGGIVLIRKSHEGGNILNKFLLKITISFALLLAFTMPVFASEQQPTINQTASVLAVDQTFTEWPVQKDVPINKVWSIKLSSSISASTVNDQNIYVVDSSGQHQNVKVSLAADTKMIQVTPLENYKSGESYTLYILKALASASPNSIALKSNLRMQFTVATAVTVKSINASNVTTTAGTAPLLPTSVTALMSDGATKVVNVTWVTPTPSQYASSGTFTVSGIIVESTTIKATATVTVVNSVAIISSISDITKTINQGDTYSLPLTIEAIMSDDAKKQVAITWNPLMIDTSKLGTYTFNGSVVGYGRQIKLTLKIAINPPSAVKAKAISSSQIQIGWNQVPGADYYHVLYSNSPNGTFTLMQISPGKSEFLWVNDYSAGLPGIPANTTLYFIVTSVKDGVESKVSNIASATTFSKPALSAPTNLVATAISTSEITVQWDKVADADYYYAYHSNDGETFYPWTNSDGSKIQYNWILGSSSFKVSGIQANSKFYIKLTAVKNGVESDYSNIVSATTFSSTISAPSNVVATAISSSQITLQWDQVSGAEYYYVYYSNDDGKTYLTCNNSSGNKMQCIWLPGHSITLNSNPANFTVYFKVTAVKNGVESDYSKVAYATTLSNSGPITPDVIESSIDGEFTGWTGDTIFKLLNGQIWQQSSFDWKWQWAYSPKVTIYKSGSVYKMKVDGVDGTINVTRLK